MEFSGLSVVGETKEECTVSRVTNLGNDNCVSGGVGVQINVGR